MVIVTKYDWIKDALIPFLIFAGIMGTIVLGGHYPHSVIAAFGRGDGKTITMFGWVLLLLLSCFASSIGAVLRRLDRMSHLAFELPGAIAASFGIFMYSFSIAVTYFPENVAVILPFSISSVLGIHFVFRAIALIATVRLYGRNRDE